MKFRENFQESERSWLVEGKDIDKETFFQRGEKPNDFKSMLTIGKGVAEIPIWTGDTYRIFYRLW